MPHVPGLMHDFFAGYMMSIVDTDKTGCPPFKPISANSGTLLAGDKIVKFQAIDASDWNTHPLNKLLQQLYKMLIARYAVMRYEQATAFAKDSSSKLSTETRTFAQGFSLPGEAEKSAKILESFLGMWSFPFFLFRSTDIS